MKGEFKQSFIKYIFCMFFILTGSFIAIRFALWGITELQLNQISSAVFCFVFVIIGLLFGFLSIVIFNFNRKAFLSLENGKIDAHFGWDKELHTDISNITNAEVQGKNLKLFIGNHLVWIYNLNNAKEICAYILSHIPKQSFISDMEEAKEQYKKCRKSYVIYLVATCIAVAFLFIHITWCVFLTDGKELSQFSESDNFIFIAFIFAELFTVFIVFLLASKCGKIFAVFNQSKLHLLASCALQRKYDQLDSYPHVINTKYFDHYTYRIVVYSTEENLFAYMLERFDIKTLSWIYCYEFAKGFETLSELYDDLESSFADVLLED